MTRREDFSRLTNDQFRVEAALLPVRGRLDSRRSTRSKWSVVIEPARWQTGDAPVKLEPALLEKLTPIIGADLTLGLTAKEGLALAQHLRKVVGVLGDLIELAEEGRGLVCRRIKNDE